MTKRFPITDLPHFNEIDPSKVPPQLKKILTENKNELGRLLTQSQFTWENLMQPLEERDDALSRFWSPVAHLHAVCESEALREMYRVCVPLITEYYTELGQNEQLYMATQSIARSPQFQSAHPAQRKIIQDELRDFKLAGVDLPPEKKARFAELEKLLSELSTKFSENILDATQGWFLSIQDKSDLAGLPEQALKIAEENAQSHGREGWLITLDYPSYSSAIKFLKNRELRRIIYEAHATRASDQGPCGGKWDNAPVMRAIMLARYELAQLVGFKNFAEYSLATKMAKKPEIVLKFLNDLLHKTKPVAKKEMDDLKKFAAETDGITDFQVWDVAYYSEKMRQARFDFSQEELRAYFPIDKVLAGMFSLVKKIFGIDIQQEKNIETWNPQVQFFALYDEQNQFRGGVYMDLYARPNKREGAWMDECRVRRKLANGSIQYPVAFLTCNFMRPVEDEPALLTHEEVETLFHEFGHCLHHMLTQVDYASVSGINGVLWDAVEFPSQFMENWCWEKESLMMISGHYKTGKPLPESLYQKLLATKYFQAGLQMIRQLEFSLFDFRLHLEFDPEKSNQIEEMLEEVRKETRLLEIPAYNRFENTFAHIFAGSYAAGYYSYKWAEVLSADAFSQFKEHGTLDEETGRSFLKNILEAGGVYDPLATFVAFRGREPQVDALLKQYGLVK